MDSGHWNIEGNENDSPAEKGSQIMQTRIKPTTFYSEKIHVHKSRRNKP